MIGGVLVLLLKYTCLAALIDRAPALIVALTLGRWAMSIAMVIFPYGRPDGLGRDMKNHAGWAQVALASCMMLATVALVAPIWGALALAAAVSTIAVWAAFVMRRVPGFTGDTYDALCEVVETVARCSSSL